MEEKLILDACCGGRCFWFDKEHPNAIYMDIREIEKGSETQRPNFCVKPDLIGDFTNMPFESNRFKLVVWDPPHIKRLNDNKSWLSRRYGLLKADWKEVLEKGFNECWRVLDHNGVLVFKWSEAEIPVSECLKLFKERPLFGHTTGRAGTTKWILFMKLENGKKT